MIVAYIDEYRNELGVEPICRVLTEAGTKIAPNTYYAFKTRPLSARSVSDGATSVLIERLCEDNYGIYGARKVHAELHRQGHRVARCTVQRLMTAAGLRGMSRAKGRGPRFPAPARTPARTWSTGPSGPLLSAAGVPLEEVAEVLGHASTRVTSATYRHRTSRLSRRELGRWTSC